MFFVGCDLASSADYTACVVVEQVQGETRQHRYDARHIERLPLGTRYPDVIRYLQDLMGTSTLAKQGTLVVDATGVGTPVLHQLQASGLRPVGVLLHGGDTVSRAGAVYRVPKRDVIGCVQVLLQSRRVRFAANLPHVETLLHELLNFKVRIDPSTAHDSYSAWREQDHDDLVLALALACWYAEHGFKRARAWP